MYSYTYHRPIYNLEPYYKKGGFYYTLEKISDKLDHIWFLIEWYGPIYAFCPKRLRTLHDYKRFTRECQKDIEYYKECYNKEKYFWMKPIS